ncbi:MAG: hypothetical protein N4A54_00195 [Peptostreptococcaceae bacterium]|nr:hypothetical protein [Peptostreptococcaceae bacterium]
MNYKGIEDISLYNNYYIFRVYDSCDDVVLGGNEKFILKILINEVKEAFNQRVEENGTITCFCENIEENHKPKIEDIKRFLEDEILYDYQNYSLNIII